MDILNYCYYVKMGELKKRVFLGLFLLSIINLALAEEGCYTNKESMLYCFDLEEEDVLEDCGIYEDCRLENVFSPGKSCEDLGAFTECEEIFCKSTCDYDFLGKCLGGKIPAGKEHEWCSAGCCRFEFYGQEFCDFKESKWLCEVEAKNKDVMEFSFGAKTSEQECKEVCSKVLILGEKITEGLVMEEVSEAVVVVEEVPSYQPSPPAPIPGEEVKEVKEVKEEGIGLILVLFVLLLLIVFYLLYQKYKSGEREVLVMPPVKRKPRFFVRRRVVKEQEERIKKLAEERERKIEEMKRAALFRLFGEAKKKKITYVDLLGKVAKSHELRKRIRAERDVFKEMGSLIKGLTRGKAVKLTEEEAKKVFEKLKKIIEWKK